MVLEHKRSGPDFDGVREGDLELSRGNGLGRTSPAKRDLSKSLVMLVSC